MKTSKTSKIKKGTKIYIDGVAHVVAEILGGTGKNTSSIAERNKPSITAYKIHHNQVLKRSTVFVGTQYSTTATT